MADLWYFVPDDSIDAVVLSFYLAEYIDKRSQLRPGKHDVAQRSGWHIKSKSPLTKEDLVCIVNDTKEWSRESKRGNVSHYVNSKTAQARKEAGRGREARKTRDEPSSRPTPRPRESRRRVDPDDRHRGSNVDADSRSNNRQRDYDDNDDYEDYESGRGGTVDRYRPRPRPDPDPRPGHPSGGHGYSRRDNGDDDMDLKDRYGDDDGFNQTDPRMRSQRY